MTIEELGDYIKENWDSIREQIRGREYKPQPVRRVEIPKPDGGVRKLGIPTVMDRVIQQGIVQIISPMCEPLFSEWSYGFTALPFLQGVTTRIWKKLISMDLCICSVYLAGL